MNITHRRKLENQKTHLASIGYDMGLLNDCHLPKLLDG